MDQADQVQWRAMSFGDKEFTEVQVSSCIATLSFQVTPYSFSEKFRPLCVAVTFHPDDENPTHEEFIRYYQVGDLYPSTRTNAFTNKPQDSFISGRVDASGNLSPCDINSEDPADHVGTVILGSSETARFWGILPWAQFIKSLGKTRDSIPSDLSEMDRRIRAQFDDKPGSGKGKKRDDGTFDEPRAVLCCTRVLDLLKPAPSSGPTLEGDDDREAFLTFLHAGVPLDKGGLVVAVMKAVSSREDAAKQQRWINAVKDETLLTSLGLTKNNAGVYAFA